MTLRPLALSALCLAIALPCGAAERSYKARKVFKIDNPCPATGKSSGACPGWVMDHIIPLCAGGRDEPWNLSWQTVEDAKAKDRIEVRDCRSNGRKK